VREGTQEKKVKQQILQGTEKRVFGNGAGQGVVLQRGNASAHICAENHRRLREGGMSGGKVRQGGARQKNRTLLSMHTKGRSSPQKKGKLGTSHTKAGESGLSG